MATNKYICKVCGYIHTGDAAPDMCPVCKVPASEFEKQKPEGMFSNKNSNAYIITYSTVMVVLVAAVLAFVSLSLQPMQNANILNEKRNAILAALSAEGENYDEFITAMAVDSKGKKIEAISSDEVIDLLSDLPTAFENNTLPVFQAKDGRVVVPVTGAGLWGPIWGYVALEKDKNTVAGIVMDHKGETPGLGAEIATPSHQAKYVGKKIFDGGDFVSITLVKGGAKPGDEHAIDGLTGGTKTADGVSDMLKSSLSLYVPYFK